DLSARRAANGVAKALSMARSAIGPVGPNGVPALMSEGASIRLHHAVELTCDLTELHHALRTAVSLAPGDARDAALVAGIAAETTLLPEEPYASWAIEARDELEELRRTARLELGRDRSNGRGQADPQSVMDAWSAVA